MSQNSTPLNQIAESIGFEGDLMVGVERARLWLELTALLGADGKLAEHFAPNDSEIDSKTAELTAVGRVALALAERLGSNCTLGAGLANTGRALLLRDIENLGHSRYLDRPRRGRGNKPINLDAKIAKRTLSQLVLYVQGREAFKSWDAAFEYLNSRGLNANRNTVKGYRRQLLRGGLFVDGPAYRQLGQIVRRGEADTLPDAKRAEIADFERLLGEPEEIRILVRSTVAR